MGGIPLDRVPSAIAIFIVLVIGSIMVSPSPVIPKARADASTPPPLQITDSWKYSHNNSVTSIASVIGISRCGNDYCTVVEEASQGQAGEALFQWVTSDWSLFKDNLTRSGTSKNDTFSPPAPVYSFPLTVGKTWTIYSKVQTTVVTSDGAQTNSSNWYETRKVSAEETITVQAGTFDTFVIDGFNGASRQVLRRWYSYQAKTSVREESYDPSNGAITSSFELVSCAFKNGFTCHASSTPSSTGLSSSAYEALGAASVVGIVGVGGLLFFRARSRQKRARVRPPKRR